jgi:hypothetical protein
MSFPYSICKFFILTTLFAIIIYIYHDKSKNQVALIPMIVPFPNKYCITFNSITPFEFPIIRAEVDRITGTYNYIFGDPSLLIISNYSKNSTWYVEIMSSSTKMKSYQWIDYTGRPYKWAHYDLLHPTYFNGISYNGSHYIVSSNIEKLARFTIYSPQRGLYDPIANEWLYTKCTTIKQIA